MSNARRGVFGTGFGVSMFSGTGEFTQWSLRGGKRESGETSDYKRRAPTFSYDTMSLSIEDEYHHACEKVGFTALNQKNETENSAYRLNPLFKKLSDWKEGRNPFTTEEEIKKVRKIQECLHGRIRARENRSTSDEGHDYVISLLLFELTLVRILQQLTKPLPFTFKNCLIDEMTNRKRTFRQGSICKSLYDIFSCNFSTESCPFYNVERNFVSKDENEKQQGEDLQIQMIENLKESVALYEIVHQNDENIVNFFSTILTYCNFTIEEKSTLLKSLSNPVVPAQRVDPIPVQTPPQSPIQSPKTPTRRKKKPKAQKQKGIGK